ncbi:MAG TPA: glycosyltransferase family 2 protein [Candidatus Saccharimonadales bacterium]|nr:glycosyltransferase family 2 protein [Candidatus Saccharimonadales bacterium]
MNRLRKIAVIIPCYNEAEGIANVISKFPHDRLTRDLYDIAIYVVDNNSSDNTAEAARQAGATVIHESQKGKGNAMRTGFRSIPDDVDYVVMLDGDDTYAPSEILRMLEPLRAGFSDVVIGSRMGGHIHGDSMPKFNLAGNWIFTHLVRYVYRANVTDVLTGYFAWKKEVIDSLHPHLVSDGFAIEMEMITKMARMNHRITSVPISYLQRAGETNLHPLKDGLRILKMFIRNLSWRPQNIAPVLVPTKEDLA